MNFEEFDRYMSEEPTAMSWLDRFDFEVAHLVTIARLTSGLTQAQLAKRAGTQQPGIARLEQGTSAPSLTLLKKIAVAIGAELIPPRFSFATPATFIDYAVVPKSQSISPYRPFSQEIQSDLSSSLRPQLQLT